MRGRLGSRLIQVESTTRRIRRVACTLATCLGRGVRDLRRGGGSQVLPLGQILLGRPRGREQIKVSGMFLKILKG